MLYQIATIVVLLLLAVIGFIGIQKSGNYESGWGSLFTVGSVSSIVMVLGTAAFSLF